MPISLGKFTFSDESSEESKLQILARQTKESLSGKVLKVGSGKGKDEDDSDETSSMLLPASYDIVSLQLG